MSTASPLLQQAESAYHKLVCGQSVRETVDQNGERTTYTAATASTLLAYIRQLGGPTWMNAGTAPQTRGPMRVFF